MRSAKRSQTVFSRADSDPIYEAAEAAFVRNDLESSALLLAACEPASPSSRARAMLLRAKLARIAGADENLFTLGREATREGAPEDVRLSGLALTALAARSFKGERESRRLFERLAVECERARPADAAYAIYIAALDAWERRDYDSAERLAKQNIARNDEQTESLALLGWIAVKREQYVQSGAFFRKALSIVRRTRPLPLRHYEVLVLGVLNAAVETVDLPVCTRMAKAYDEIAGSSLSALVRFGILGRLRYAALLEGDLERAWMFGRAEATVFADGPYAASGNISASVVTRALGDERTADLQLDSAWKILREFRWGAAHAQERIVLLDFACVAAAHRPSQARKSLMLYVSITEREDPEESLTRDRRVTATEHWAAGRVADALGDRAEALGRYRGALELLENLGCLMRAADVALDLSRLTRDPVYHEAIDALAARAPNAFIVRRAREFDGPLGKLGPLQRGILAKILRGEGAKAIATELGRSPYTVINHTRKIFDAFEVHSRAELRRACAKAKITPETIP